MLRIIRTHHWIKNIHYARIFQETLSTVFIEWILLFSFQWIIISVDCYFFARSKLPYTITEVNKEFLQWDWQKCWYVYTGCMIYRLVCLSVWSRSSCSYKCHSVFSSCKNLLSILWYLVLYIHKCECFFVKEHFEWHTSILQQFINEARLYSYCNKKLMPIWLCNKVWPSITLNKAILHEILDTSLNSFRFMLYIGVKEWICIHKNCCHDESNDPREDKLICLLTEMEFHTF